VFMGSDSTKNYAVKQWFFNALDQYTKENPELKPIWDQLSAATESSNASGKQGVALYNRIFFDDFSDHFNMNQTAGLGASANAAGGGGGPVLAQIKAGLKAAGAPPSLVSF